MMVPSRSTKTAGDSALVIFAVLSETGDKLIACHGRCSKLADHNSASVVGDFRRFNRSRAGDVENLPCLGWDVMRRFVLLEKHHAVFAERDEDIFCFPFLKQRFTGAPQIGIFRRSLVWFSPGNA